MAQTPGRRNKLNMHSVLPLVRFGYPGVLNLVTHSFELAPHFGRTGTSTERYKIGLCTNASWSFGNRSLLQQTSFRCGHNPIFLIPPSSSHAAADMQVPRPGQVVTFGPSSSKDPFGRRSESPPPSPSEIIPFMSFWKRNQRKFKFTCR